MLKNKLLVTTALVSAMFAGSAAVAEIKMKGGAEFTYLHYNDATAGVDSNPNGAFIGREAVVNLSAGGDLAGLPGTKWFWSGDLEDTGSVFATQEMGITSGKVSLILGSDTSHGIEAVKGIVPTAVKRVDDIGGSSDSDLQTADVATGIFGPVVHDNTSDEAFVALRGVTPMGTISIAHTPNIAATNALSEDSGPGQAAKRSGTSISFSGNLGVDGLTVRAGMLRNSTATAANDEEEGLIYGAAYNFGKFALGASRTTNNEDVVSTASVEIVADDFGLTFNPTDQLSVGLGYRSATRTVDGATADVDLEVTHAQVGYSLGAIALNYIYASSDNASFINNRDVTLHRVGAKLSF